MSTARALALAGPGALILAIAIGFWPVHATIGFGGTVNCGSAFRPIHASDSYDVLSDKTGAALAATQAVDERCDAARSGPGYVARAAGAAGLAVLVVAFTRSRRREGAAAEG
ncbi:hypothetical protein [Actinomadura fibrosa]|uniref:Uncharacterized protein n=1 Tax=Actinomadura fibrosa TaxID=111802 RepID=A0ABW2XQ67_9ACTN|nr:hypothetical protein [Actinomadura fibrosa]